MPPLERLGLPDDIAEVVSFLAGPARWVNGQVIYVKAASPEGVYPRVAPLSPVRADSPAG
jgi:hypothetical protein